VPNNPYRKITVIIDIYMSGDPLTMDYFDNVDNGPLNKYKKILKIEKKFICVILHLD
jgi:hypothetical protein